MKLIKQLGLITGLLALLIQPSWGAALAGHVILTKGNVTALAEDGTDRPLKRRSQIFNGDTIKTGPSGSVQVRFVDKALMTIKANSEMNIERYLLAQQGNEAEKEQVLMSLVKGGFRTITGTIGKGDKDAYKVNTPAASIGIRGTNYEVQQENDGGFVMGVYSGGIQVENEAGTIELGEGADFNFTRVKPNASPKGLLAPPPALGENTATEQNEEESEDTADEKNSGTNEADENSEADSEESEVAEGDAAESDTTQSNNAKETNALVDIGNTAPDLGNDVSNAIDNKLADTIQETADKVEDTLIDQGILGTFDFNNPYRGVDATNSNNPFLENVITDEQYALGESGRLGLIAVPVNFNFGASGTPDVPLAEASLISPESALVTAHDFSVDSAMFSFSYEVYNTTTKKTDVYELNFTVDEGVLAAEHFNNYITNAFEDPGFTYIKNGESVTGPPDAGILLSYNTAEDKYVFTSDSSNGDYFITEMELYFNEDPANKTATDELKKALGSSTNFNRDDWYSSTEVELIIANGSWDATGNKPIMLEMETDENGNRIAVIRKPNESNHVASSLLDYFDLTLFGQEIAASCGSGESGSPTPCDVQVENAGGRSNISWGIWFTEPSEGIVFDEIKSDGTIESDTENDILAFWIAAERADINQLTGTAEIFSATNLDCTKASQCIGFADDGLVRNLSASFDVNFNSGAITNGNLNIQTATDLDSAAISTWDVNFAGSMVKDGVKQPEFNTESLTGNVKNSSDAIISENIIGNIGGIFVKPGDKFAGAYNLGAINSDGVNHKHAAGVFSLDKQ
ncbi:MAG: hypothetical protein ACJA1U_000911 [Bermanella sp.]|jgi:hypothetical protein